MTAYESPSTLPERILVANFGKTNSHGPVFHAQPTRPDGTEMIAIERAYVREDVARAETEAAVKKAIEEERARAWETCHVDE